MMALLLGQRAYPIHERKRRFKIPKLITANDVMLVDDIPLFGFAELMMNIEKIFSF